MLFFLIILQFIFCISFKIIQEPDVIQLEEYTNLICVFDKNYNYNRGWLKNNYTFIIFNSTNKIIHTKNQNEEKYNAFIINNKLILRIKNINEDDKKNNFSCYFDYDNYDFNPFISPIFKNDINIEYFFNNPILAKLNINLNKIFTIPECFNKKNNKSIASENIIYIEKINYLYSRVNLSMIIKKTYCSNKIKIICTLIGINLKNNNCLLNRLIIVEKTTPISKIIMLLVNFFLISMLFQPR